MTYKLIPGKVARLYRAIHSTEKQPQGCIAMICMGDNDTLFAPHIRRGARPWVAILRPLERQ